MELMKIKIPTGKQVLIPGMILAVAAMGLLFFLQIRWMNQSMQAQNMRYRHGVADAMNHVARGVFEKLGVDQFDSDNPERFLEEANAASPHGDVIKSVTSVNQFRSERAWPLFELPQKEVFLIVGTRDKPYVLTLDSAILYEQIFPDVLREYSHEYSYNISYRKMKLSEIFKTRKEYKDNGTDNPFIKAYLPLVIDFTNNNRPMDNLQLNSGDFFYFHNPDDSLGPENFDTISIYLHVLEINLNDGRGSREFEKRLRRTNLGLIASLCLILVGFYSLLLRLYRREENQRRLEQTFMASVSHELRTPIAVIKTASENLSRGIIHEGDRVKSYGHVIGTEADRLNRLVEGILYYSRMEGSGRTSINREEVNPRLFTAEILDTLRMTYPDGALEADLAGAPEKVRLDRDSYQQIVDNLVTNGLLHGGGGPLRIRLESDFPARWRLVVEDCGPGLPRREQKAIFDPFVRGRRSEDKQTRGSGLGLFLVKRAAEAMGGSVTLESPYQFPAGIERQGCRFTLIMPISKEE
jgi:signal transduction histidine kinase